MNKYRQILEQRKGQHSHIEKQLHYHKGNLNVLNEYKENLEKAQAIIQIVAQATQEEFKYQITELVSLAEAAVFDDPYELDIEFVQKRNQTEANLWFVREGERIHPLSASGGGAVDVAAFALRVSLWSLLKPKSRPILILDEPFSRLKGEDANVKVIQMVKEVSQQLGLQIIMISDERVPLHDIEAGADKVFKVSIKKGISQITT